MYKYMKVKATNHVHVHYSEKGSSQFWKHYSQNQIFFYFQKCLILEIWKHLEINYFLIDMLEYFLWHLVFGNNTSESYMIKWCRLRENINLKTTAAILQWKSFCSPGFTEIYK